MPSFSLSKSVAQSIQKHTTINTFTKMETPFYTLLDTILTIQFGGGHSGNSFLKTLSSSGKSAIPFVLPFAFLVRGGE
jgi:hypothetical protein